MSIEAEKGPFVSTAIPIPDWKFAVEMAPKYRCKMEVIQEGPFIADAMHRQKSGYRFTDHSGGGGVGCNCKL